MTLQDQIHEQISQLPPEKQAEVLDFIAFLLQRNSIPGRSKRQSLKQHPAFGSWRKRKINALHYQQSLRSEWDERM